MLIKAAWTFPEHDWVVWVFGKEKAQIFQNSHWLDLKQIGGWVKYSLSSMNGVGDDNNLGDIRLGYGLIDVTSNSKYLGFCASYECSMMDSFDKRLIGNMCVRDWCSDVVFDASIWCYNGCGLRGGSFDNHWVKLLNMRFVAFPFHI